MWKIKTETWNTFKYNKIRHVLSHISSCHTATIMKPCDIYPNIKKQKDETKYKIMKKTQTYKNDQLQKSQLYKTVASTESWICPFPQETLLISLYRDKNKKKFRFQNKRYKQNNFFWVSPLVNIFMNQGKIWIVEQTKILKKGTQV